MEHGRSVSRTSGKRPLCFLAMSPFLPTVLSLLMFLVIVGWNDSVADAFQYPMPGRLNHNRRSSRVSIPLQACSSSTRPPKRKAPNRSKLRSGAVQTRRSSQPELVEAKVSAALASMRATWSSYKEHDNNTTVLDMLLFFPTVRECNAALAAFGDDGELLRALRLFGKMRKAAALQQVILSQTDLSWPVPTPTLVTYSTLMSRAVRASKPRVALRLWKLKDPHLAADVRAANILMNCFAKLADVKAAQNLLEQLCTGSGPDVPALEPNLVTFNTLLDGCQKAGDLDAALQAKEALEQAGLRPDQRTYTSLIATVARQPSKSAGQNDPTTAFMLLQEMRDKNIRPNGMTYSALIDVCGRCKRSDLALKGLRMLLRQKAQEQEELPKPRHDSKTSPPLAKPYTLQNEVGAWTAAINACGKVGRLDTAIKLFYAMPNFGVDPNEITCGCLTDSLLRAGRTAEMLDVLRYMKQHNIVPSEVMYTSLMTRAERLVQTENQRQPSSRRRHHVVAEEDSAAPATDEAGDTTAIEVYTALMKSLVDGNRQAEDSNTLLLKVFLVFQEMKTAGAQADVACYNALLKACARAGDVRHAENVLCQMQVAGLDPNDSSWREMIRTAGKLQRSDLAESFWKMGLAYSSNQVKLVVDEPRTQRWKPSIESLAALVSVYLRQASQRGLDASEKQRQLERVAKLYEDALYGNFDMGMHRIDLNQLLDSQQTMMLILQCLVKLEGLHCYGDDVKRQDELRSMAASILKLDCFGGVEYQRLAWASYQAIEKAKSWAAMTR